MLGVVARLDPMDNEQTIGSNELAIIVEMGDDFEPGNRTAAALSELAEALNEEHGEEVSGFNFEKPSPVRSFSFMSSPELHQSSFYEAWPAKWKGFSLNGKGNNQ
jgi:hypothetical protein